SVAQLLNWNSASHTSDTFTFSGTGSGLPNNYSIRVHYTSTYTGDIQPGGFQTFRLDLTSIDGLASDNTTVLCTLSGITGISRNVISLPDWPPGSAGPAVVLAGSDAFHGGAGNDIMTAYAGNDTLSSGGGSDQLDGGGGWDTAVFTGQRASYSVARNANG